MHSRSMLVAKKDKLHHYSQDQRAVDFEIGTGTNLHVYASFQTLCGLQAPAPLWLAYSLLTHLQTCLKIHTGVQI